MSLFIEDSIGLRLEIENHMVCMCKEWMDEVNGQEAQPLTVGMAV